MLQLPEDRGAPGRYFRLRTDLTLPACPAESLTAPAHPALHTDIAQGCCWNPAPKHAPAMHSGSLDYYYLG